MLDWMKKAAWFSLAILFLCLVIVFIFVPFNSMNETDMEAESPVIQKSSTKGLYMGPNYHVMMLNGDRYDVSKKEIYQLQIGDTYGTQKKSSIKTAILLGAILYPASILILWFVWGIFSGLFPESRLVQWVYKKERENKKRLKDIGGMALKIGILLFIVICTVIYLFIGKNLFYKMNPMGKEEAMAEIIDKEQERTSYGRGVTEKYTFALQYQDQTGTTYKTEKGVSSFTYQLYQNGDEIAITYRIKHPYDTFIKTSKIGEILSVLISWGSFLILTGIYINYFLIKRIIEERSLDIR
ncbi:DUF3592 domain-containing protein [Oceanobacillus timonensis]|uniref:DUF3592 domain-containing protein n=1 Tax=Oceanobacillus timonensis TaxID=1926285 RepID=UPI0009B9F8F9|nr:DUF3592 domain-containing protein [Oceanobacillus timonensis]